MHDTRLDIGLLHQDLNHAKSVYNMEKTSFRDTDIIFGPRDRDI
jgi:hypothetical protein